MKKPIHTASRSARDEPPTPLKGAKLSPDSALGTITVTLACSKVCSTGEGGGAQAKVSFSGGTFQAVNKILSSRGSVRWQETFCFSRWDNS